MKELLRNSDFYLLNKENFMFKIDRECQGRLDIPKQGYVIEVTSLVTGEEQLDDIISAMLFLMDNPMVELNGDLYELCMGGCFDEDEQKYIILLYVFVNDEEYAKEVCLKISGRTIYGIKEEEIVTV